MYYVFIIIIIIFIQDWIGDTPFDNPEIRMDYDGHIETEQFRRRDRSNDLPPLRRTISAEVLLDKEQPGEEQEGRSLEPWFPGQRSETPPISRREYLSPNVVEVMSPNEAKKMLQDNRNKPSRSRPMVISISSQSSVSDSVSSSIKTIGSAVGNGGRSSSLANIRESDCEERGEGGSVFYYSSPSPPLQSKSGDNETGSDSVKGEKNDKESEGGQEEGEGEGEEGSRKISGQVVASSLVTIVAATAAAALALRK